MKRLLFSLFAICSLAACASTTSTLPAAPSASSGTVIFQPGPLNATPIDDQAVKFAFEAFDSALYAVDLAVAVKVIVPGSPKALRIRTYVRETQKWLNAASAAQKAGSASSYAEAFRKAQDALAILNQTIK